MYERAQTSGCKRTLTELAKIIGLPRKTLDDYYQMIQKGARQGFQFERYAREKMGFLRAYVKGRRDFKPQATPSGMDSSSDEEVLSWRRAWEY
jgi:hypothetical protein